MKNDKENDKGDRNDEPQMARKFEEVDDQFQHLETAYGLGYRWRGDT